MSSFFEELKRRNVFRVGIAYIIATWLVLQVADVVLGNISAPDWVFKTLLLFLSLGAPVVLVFAWAFEMTPEGLKREKDVDRSRSVTHVTGRKLDRAIIVVLVLAVGYFAVDKFYLQGNVGQDSSHAAQPEHNRRAATQGAVGSGSLSSITSIAVLPFVNMSSDKEQDYFSDGISEELLNLLAKIPAFRVAGRTSSFAFKGKNDDLRTIGESLGVSTILEGSVRKGADRVRITAQLVKVDDGFHLWSETYDRELTDVLAVQDEIAGAVVKELKVTLLGEQAAIHSSNSLTGNAEAYNAYLQGLYFWNQTGPDYRQKAAKYFEQAVALVPDSALAWAMLSLADANYAAQSSDGSPAALARAREAAAKALELDDTVAEAHLAAATLDYLYNWDWDAAERAVERALALRPGDIQARKMLFDLRMNQERLQDAREILAAAQLQDPLDISIQTRAMDVLFYSGDYLGAEQKGLEVLAKDPGRAFARSFMGWVLMADGRLQEALAYMEAEPVRYARFAGLAILQHKLGNQAAAEAARQELWDAYGEAASYQQAEIYAGWGQDDKAVEWLERGYQVRDPGMPQMRIDTSFASIKQHPGYIALLQKMNLADE
jgi:adenylate cyclase